MPDANAGFWNNIAQVIGRLLNAHNSVMDKVDLSSAINFSENGGADEGIIGGGDSRFDGQAFFRWGINDAHIADAGQGHVQRAGNWGGAEGQSINVGFHLFQPLFVHHAETLLFVNNQQSQLLKSNIFLEQTMGANDDINAAGS